jgi:hypothetical protein
VTHFHVNRCYFNHIYIVLFYRFEVKQKLLNLTPDRYE